MTQPEQPEPLETSNTTDEDDDSRPDRVAGQSDPWHGLDDFDE